jgi:hypothetical protein
MKTIRRSILLMLAACGSAEAGEDYFWDDLWAPYTERHDKMTGTSGNAQEVNGITHIITPWPPYVQDRRIPGDAVRMGAAVKCYQARHLPPECAPSPPLAASTSSGGSQSGNSGQAAR